MSYKQQRIGHIVAMDKNRCIGADNKIPWRLPADLKRFKALTSEETGYHLQGVVFMGRKTFESMGSKPLPNRFNIILTSDKDYMEYHPYCQTVHSVEAGLDMMVEVAKLYEVQTAWVIGGEWLFKDTIEYADVLEITHVDIEVPKQDAMYPIDPLEYMSVVKSETNRDDKRGLTYHYVTYNPK